MKCEWCKGSRQVGTPGSLVRHKVDLPTALYLKSTNVSRQIIYLEAKRWYILFPRYSYTRDHRASRKYYSNNRSCSVASDPSG